MNESCQHQNVCTKTSGKRQVLPPGETEAAAPGHAGPPGHGTAPTLIATGSLSARARPGAQRHLHGDCTRDAGGSCDLSPMAIVTARGHHGLEALLGLPGTAPYPDMRGTAWRGLGGHEPESQQEGGSLH